jgi:hypothetical protein
MNTQEARLPYIWDYEISEQEFQAMLAGKLSKGRMGRDWAAVRAQLSIAQKSGD